MTDQARSILFSTTNPHKVREVAAIFAPSGIVVLGLDSLGPSLRGLPEPVEDGPTFAENARIKARYYAERCKQRCLAEDSGLEVDALGGAPGVHSARYSGEGGDRAERDQANNAKLLRALEGVPAAERTARFVCAMALADPDGSIVAETRGTFEGVIAPVPRGEGGFGYDPLLWLPDLGKTSAELTAEDKNARSHRGAATRAMAALLRGD